ncbi:unnamed protein product [Colletotrichum noveboracense]|uniref:Uncharacterized protein n=1 Tax=Colletotrichum noveboracense TaxID=2664923 RepID=A0A9W4RYC3_9PEZI|nr:unnamed protein product [Colletotrichum noveboracense]
MAWHGIGILEILGIHGASNRSSRSNTQELDERESRPSAFAYTEDGVERTDMTMFKPPEAERCQEGDKDDASAGDRTSPAGTAESGFPTTNRWEADTQNPGNPLMDESYNI